MALKNWLRSLWNHKTRGSRRVRWPRLWRARIRPVVEGLEDRLAPTVAYQIPGATVGNQAFGGPLGMDFDVNQPIVVTQLGVFDSGSDGLASPITATLYQRTSPTTGTQIDQLPFAAGNTGTLVGGSRFLPLASPLVLPAGFHGTIVAEGYSAAEPDGNATLPPYNVNKPWTTNDGGGLISFVGSRFGTTPNTFPDTAVNGGPADTFAAGTFQFFAVNSASTFVDDNWNLVQDNGDGVLSVGDRVSNNNDTINPGTVTGTYGVDAFGVVTTSSVVGENLGTGSVAGAATINNAISNTAVGGTVNVLEGTYNQLVQVTKTLTLRGAQAGVDAQNGRPGAAESIISNGTGDFQILADNVTIDGFTVQGVNIDVSVNPSSLNAGIWTNPAASGTHGGTVILNNIVQNNIIGIELANDGTFQTTVQRNLIQNNNQSGGGSGNGVEADFGLRNALITDNTISNNNSAGVSLFSSAGTQSGVTISQNLMNADGNAVALVNAGSVSSPIVIDHNTITNSVGSQIALDGGDNGVQITHNIIHNGATRGVRILDAGFGGGPNSNVTVNTNSIQGNATAGLEEDAGGYTGGTLDATNNWWGSATGPTAPNNPGGTGDALVDQDGVVIFSPFLASGTNTATGRGFDPAANAPIGIVVNGTGADDTVVFTATGPDSGSYTVNGGPVQGPYSNIASFTFNGNAGSDTLIIHNPSGGLFAPSGGIFYNGGGQSGDNLQDLGGQATSGSYTPNPAGSPQNAGTLREVNGNTTQTITFTGLAPMTLAPAVPQATFTYNSTDTAAGAILYQDGPVIGGNQYNVINDQSPGAESLTFTNIQQMNVNTDLTSAGAAKTVDVQFSTGATALTSLIFNDNGAGGDGFNVLATPAAVSTTLNGGSGGDTFNITDNSLKLDQILGPVTANGGTGTGNTLLVTDTSSTAAYTYAVTATTINRTGGAITPGTITYSAMQDLHLSASNATPPAGNTINMTGAAAGTSYTINAGSGNDSINVSGTGNAAALTVNGQGGADTLTVDFSAGNPSPPGGVNYHGGGQTGDNLRLTGIVANTVTNTFLPDSSGTPHLGTINLDGSVVNYDGVHPVTFSGTMANLIFNVPTGDGDNQTILEDNGTAGDGISQVRSGNGSFETTTFTNPTTSLTINTGNDGETVTIGTPDTLFAAPTTVNGGTGDDTFNVTPSPNFAITTNGNAPTTPPGDTLNVDVTGTTSPTLTITSNNGGSLSGNYTFGNRQPVNFTSIETLSPTTADLGVTKADSPDPVLAGNNLTYSITVTNGGPLSSQNVQLTDATPTNTTFVSFAVPAGWTPGGGNPSAGGTGQVTATDPNVAPGSTSVFTLVVHVGPSTPNGTTITNTATVNSPTTQDANSLNNQSSTTTTVNTSADLAVTKTSSAGAGTVTAGSLITYTVALTNNGPSDAQGVVLTDTLSANETFQTSTDSGSGTFTPSTTGNTTTFTATGPFGPGATHTFVITALVNSNTANASTASNTATVTSPTDTNTANNTATVSNTVVTSADVQVTKTGPAAVTAGQQITYTITYTNAGPSDAPGAVLTDTVPSGTTFVSFTAPVGWTVTNQPAPGGTGLIQATDPDVVAGAGPQVFTLIVATNVNATAASTVTNTASGLSGAADPNTNNNGSTVNTAVSTSADLALTKADTPDPVLAGNNLTYSLTLVNNGPNPSQSVSLADTLPANTTFVSFTAPAGWNSLTPAVGGTGTVSSAIASVPIGSVAVFTLVVHVNSSTANNTTINNLAKVFSAGTPDPNSTNNTGTASTTVNTQADLAVTKTGPATAVAGQSFMYTITVSNSGPSDAQNVTVTDTIPGGEMLQGANAPPGGGVSVSGSTVTFTFGTVAAGAAPTARITVTTDEATVANGTVETNSATATTTTAESNSNNNTGTVNTTITNQADLSVTKTTAQATATPGTDVTYTVTLHNLGPNTARGVTLTDAVPANTTFVSAAPVAGQNPDGFSYTLSGGTVTGTPTGGTVAAGNTDEFVLVVTVNPGTPGGTTITNSATASMNSAIVVDPNAGNNTGTATVTTSAPVADLAITKTDGVTSAVPGTSTTYTIVVSNAGPSDATGASVSDPLPAGVTAASWTFIGETGGGSVTGPSGGSGALAATVNLPVNASVTFTFTVQIDPSATGTLTNTATVSPPAGVTDPNPANNSATDTDTLTPQADLAITKTDGVTSAVPGTADTYTIVVSNTGPSAVTGASVSDPLPAGVSSATWAATVNSGGGVVTGPSGGSGALAATVNLPVNASVTFTFTVQIDPSATGTLTNTATVSPPAGVTDPNPANNSATDTDTLTPQADLVTTKIESPNPVVAGQSLTYTLTVHNNGPSDAQNVTLTDNFPAGLSFQGANASQGSGTLTGSLLNFSFGTIAGGASATLTLTFGVSANTPNGTVLTNQATATSNTADPNTNNNTGTAMTTVTNQADLQVTKTTAQTAPTPGTDVTYTITLSNLGPNTAQGVTLTDAVPANTTFVSAAPVAGQNPDGFSYTLSGGTVTGTPAGGTVASGNTDEFLLVVNINPGTPGGTTITNSATASMNSAIVVDPNAGNNTGTATTVTSAPSADVVVTKAGPATVNAGQNITYTVTVADNGPSDATSVQFTDTVPANTTFVSASSTQGTVTNSGGVISGNLGTVTTTAPVTITIVVDTAPGVASGTTITNAATAFGSTADPNTGNNTGTATTTVNTSADLAVTKTGPASATPGTLVTYTISVINSGPSDAQSVALTDNTPPFTTFFSQSQTSGPAFTPSDPGQGNPGTVSDTIATLHAGESATFLFVMRVISSTPVNTAITDTATVASPTSDPNTANNNSSATTTTSTALADVAVTKTGPASVTAGNQATYTIAVTNNGPSDAQGVVLSDTTPTNTTFVALNQTGGPAATPGFSGSTATQTIPTLAAGASATFVYVVTIQASAPLNSTVQNTATVSSSTADTNTANNNSTATSTVQTSADMQVTKAGPATGTAGTDLTYTVTVSNGGPSDAQSVVFTDNIPGGTTFVSESQTGGAVTFAFPNNPAPGSSSGTIFGQAQTLAVGQTATFVLVFRANASDPNGSTVTNTAVVSSGTNDPNGGNNASSANTTINTSADLVMTKSGTATANAGTNVTYTLAVSNAGPSDAQNVQVTDTLPAGETFVSASTGTGTGTSYSSGNLGALAAGGTLTITLVAHISPSQPGGLLTDTATVSSSTSDPNATNNTATFDTTVTTSADVAITKVGPATVTAGTDITYTITTTNNGPSDAQAVQTTDSPPAGTTLVSFAQDSGPPDGSTLPAGGIETFTLVLHLNASQPSGSTITNTANASSTGGTPDPNTANNTATFSSTVATSADLSLVKTGPATAIAGTQVTYTLAVANAGPSDAQGVTVTDTLPAGTTFVSASEGSGSGTSYTDPIGTFAFGATRTITVVALVSSSVGANTSLTDTATISSTTSDPNTLNNTGTATTVIQTSADLAVTKSGPATGVAGTNVTYTIVVTNNGPSDAQHVSVTDTLPVGETFVSASQGTGSGTLYVSGDLGTLAPANTVTLTIVAHISPSVPNATVLTDSATASSSTPDPNNTNNTASFNTTVSTSADLSLVKTGPATATAGTNVTYTLTVSNAGPSDAQAVSVTDTLPTGETFVSASVGTGSGTTYNSGSLGTLAFGATTTITLVAHISPSVGSNTALTNSATAGSTTPDPNGTNNTGTFVTTVNTSADLSVTKSGPSAATAGTDLTYTVIVSNAGPSDSQGVTLTDALPANETFVSLTTPAGFTSTTPPVGSGGTITSSDPTLAAGASGVFTLVVHLSAGAPANSTVTNTATVASIGGTPDPNGGNNSSSTSLTVNTQADLAVTKTGPATAVAGTDLTYTVTVSNAGPSDSQGVSLTDTLPNGETFVSATSSQGSATQTGGVVTATLGTVANGGFATLTIVAHVGPSVPDGTTITNAATASSGTLDTTPGNNTGTTTTTVQARADLAVTKSGTPSPVTAGTNLTYTVTVSNTGPSDSQGVSLTDTLPANTTFVSATATQGTVTNSGATVTDTIGTMAAGATVTMTIVAHVASSAPNGSTLTNSATATATTTDPNTGNNTGTASTVVQTSADLAISKTASPNPPTAGTNLTYTVTVSDIGPSDAQAVTVTDSLPAGVTFVSATASQGTATNSGGVVTANLGTVTSGSAPTITVVVAVPAGTANNTTLTETASVSSTTSDPNAGNNTVTNTSTVVTRADLALSISTPPSPVTAGTNLTYTLTVTDIGPSDAQAATVTDAVPSNTTFISGTASQGTVSVSGGVVTGNLGTLAAGASATEVIILKVNSSTPDGSTITDTAAVTTTTTDPNGGNNFATVSTSVTTSADLSITKTFSPNPPAGFANLTYTITVANAGPSDSQSTVVTDALPSGTVFQSVTVSQGTASDSGGTVTANLGAVTAGTSATVTVVVNVPPGTVNGTTLTNTASVSTSTTDPNPANNSVTVSGKVIAPSAVGVFDGQAQYGDPPATWKLRNSNQPGAPDITPFQYGSPTSTPVMGDWDGNGTSTVGVVDVVGGQLQWKLRNSNTTGAADLTFTFGVQGDIPVVGDWNGDGTTTIGIVDVVPDPSNPGGQALRWRLRNTNGAGAPDITFLYGIPGDIPVTGDWNGDHTTTVGVVRPNTTTGVLTWFLRNSNSAGNPDIAPFAYGGVGSTPVTGDWNADGITTIGVYDPVFAGWKLRNSDTAGGPDIAPSAGFAYGSPNGLSLPVTGQYGPNGMLARALDGARPGSGAAPLSQADLQQTVTAALDRLGSAGVSANLLSRLAQTQFTVGTLTTGTVGAAFPNLNRVVLDATAAGHGWFVDPTPLQDEEFTLTPQGALVALPGTAAQGREDLLTAVLHEMGHIAGLADTDALGTLMGGYLPDGTRLTAALDRIFARGNF